MEKRDNSGVAEKGNNCFVKGVEFEIKPVPLEPFESRIEPFELVAWLVFEGGKVFLIAEKGDNGCEKGPILS